ncbi:MAG: DUF4384 domain-containing protein [Blastocatellia bacterium]
MKFKPPIQPSVLLAIALLAPLVPSASPAQPSRPSQKTPAPAPEEARGAFIKNRNKTANPASDAAKPGPRPTPAGNRGRRPPNQPPSVTLVTTASEPAPAPVGLGFTLYQRNERGEARRVHPATTFHKDDAVRFVIEPNVDGYLYIFYSEGEAEPMMIFPDHRLHEGDNKISAHVPYEVPSRHSKTPWFVFDEKPAVENLLIVVTKTPLAGAPTGASLVKYCLPFGEDCNWKPSKPQYDLVVAQLDQPKLVSLSKSLGQLQAATEEVAIAKGIKLKSQEPEPTIVQMNVLAALDILVMKTQLIHR